MTKEQKPMRIVSLQASNFKRLTAIEITPKGDVVTIAGKNGNGKSSTLDAIWAALGGGDAKPKQAIRKGADRAEIRLDLGDLIVTRTFRPAKDGNGETTELKVTAADGAQYRRPQEMLDAMIGRVAFDPLIFARDKPAAQFDTMRRFVPDFDFAAHDAAQEADYNARTNLNRQAKEARAVAASIALPADTPAEPIDTAALVDELQRAGELNAQIESRKARRADVAGQIEQAKRQAASLRAQAEDLRKRAAALDADAAKEDESAAALQKKLDDAPALPDPVDVTAARAAIAAAEATNKLVAERKRQAEAIANAERFEAASKALTKAMDDREEAKKAAIAKAKLPVERITFGAGELLFDGVPFDQASEADKIRTSVRLAMASNATLRVIRIRDGSALDEDSMALIAQMAAENGYQVWVEQVRSDDPTAIVIEDGRVKPAPIAEAAE